MKAFLFTAAAGLFASSASYMEVTRVFCTHLISLDEKSRRAGRNHPGALMKRNDRPDKNKNKLTLNKQTIRELKQSGLENIAGGTWGDTNDCGGGFSEHPCYC
jgi:hypothetical protein